MKSDIISSHLFSSNTYFIEYVGRYKVVLAPSTYATIFYPNTDNAITMIKDNAVIDVPISFIMYALLSSLYALWIDVHNNLKEMRLIKRYLIN